MLNEEESIGEVVSGISHELVSRVIVADGGSSDATVEQARKAEAQVIRLGPDHTVVGAWLRRWPQTIARSWFSWTAMAPTIPAQSRH